MDSLWGFLTYPLHSLMELGWRRKEMTTVTEVRNFFFRKQENFSPVLFVFSLSPNRKQGRRRAPWGFSCRFLPVFSPGRRFVSRYVAFYGVKTKMVSCHCDSNWPLSWVFCSGKILFILDFRADLIEFFVEFNGRDLIYGVNNFGLRFFLFRLFKCTVFSYDVNESFSVR